MSTTTNTARERPILFKPELVRAILDGRKTMTRRVVKPQPTPVEELGDEEYDGPQQVFVASDGSLRTPARYGSFPVACPYGAPGDRLWVREGVWYRENDGITVYDDGSMRLHPTSIMGANKVYSPATSAGPDDYSEGDIMKRQGFRRRSAIHLPRWASRLTLDVTAVRVERLQEITEEDARAEGVDPGDDIPPGFLDGRGLERARSSFAALWDRVNGKRDGASWADSPWVWVVSFKAVPQEPRS